MQLTALGLNQDQIHLSGRFPVDEEVFVDAILADLRDRGVLPTADYPKAEFEQFRDAIGHSYDHGGYHTYIFPEEARLLFAIAAIRQPRRVAVLGSYYGYWGIWAMPAVRAAGGLAWFVDVNPRVSSINAENLRRLGFLPEHAMVVTGDAVRFAEEAAGGVDLAVIDPEGDPADPRPNYRDKAIYHPVAERIIRKLAQGALAVCHNILLTNEANDPYFAEKVASYRRQYAEFLPLMERSFRSVSDYATTEGVGVYALPTG